MEERVRIEIGDGVADVRLARPDKLNALDPAMFTAIIAAITRLEGEAGIRAVVLSGEGRGFCAGLDMASMAAGGSGIDLARRSHGLANDFQQVAWGWRALPMPVIAAVHGACVGGGIDLITACDIRFAAPNAFFQVKEVDVGIVADVGRNTTRRLRKHLLCHLGPRRCCLAV